MSKPTPLALQAHQLTKQVSSPEGLLTILDDVSFKIESGTSVAICGPSGAGKSTLLSLLAGLDVASSGRCWIGGTDLTPLDEDGRAALRAHRVGFVFQSFHLVPSLTALENVMLPLELGEFPRPHRQAQQILSKVGLSERVGHYPHQLSGGEKQRVAVARAFAGNPSVLFADEPTGNLDTATGDKIIDLLFDLNHEQQTTLVLVTHDETLAARCDRILRLSAGRLVAQ